MNDKHLMPKELWPGLVNMFARLASAAPSEQYTLDVPQRTPPQPGGSTISAVCPDPVATLVNDPASVAPEPSGNCRNHKKALGHAYPKSGCQATGCGGALTGCIYGVEG